MWGRKEEVMDRDAPMQVRRAQRGHPLNSAAMASNNGQARACSSAAEVCKKFR
eukprot:CAMPEP_0181228518 /NCGR_PEP_ID=MMETSP1096-20121128/33390_1 /TAXON_ID=156174 ORGANISM="Chrysochromulina ericina, Strain CCMP281" /NCGR_SAMPLE_ID=MMETSP1096 /ASSEMBLY_ACC=CAM_ASM_000453 /LENGTH=52 /DNA_ID=CAMNT_0023322047 /DNA_START=434 /DNA_END=590 /DNA_ORIENTATION=-